MRPKPGHVLVYSGPVLIDHDAGDEDDLVDSSWMRFQTKMFFQEELTIEQWQKEQLARGWPLTGPLILYARDALHYAEGI